MSTIAKLFLLTCCVASVANGQQRDIAAILGYPQTILYNAKIVTVADSSFTSELGPIAQSMAIRDGKILAVGSDAEMDALAGPQTQKLDLKGRTVLPGLIAVHNHPHDWVHSSPKIMQKVIPEDVMVQRFLFGPPQQQLEQFPKVLEEAVRAAKPGVWVKIIFLWDIDVHPEDPIIAWPGKTITKQQLDQAAPNNPVLVRSRPTVLAQANTAMLNQNAIDLVRKVAIPEELAEVDNLVNTEKNGVIGGVAATRLVETEVIFKNRVDLYTEALKYDLSWWAGLGQTTFATFLYHHGNVLRSYRNLERSGEMSSRLAWGWGELPDAFWKNDFQDPFLVADLATRQGQGSDYMWYYGTGQIGGGCVSMEPLPNRPQDKPLVMRGPGCEGSYGRGGAVWDGLYKVVREGGRLIGSHQSGDVDIDRILALIVAASRDAGMTKEEIRSKRHTADHMDGWPRPDQVPILKDLGMIVGGTNLFIYQDLPQWMRDYGEKALDRVVPRKRLIEAGIMNGIEIDKPYEANPNGPTIFNYISWSITRQAQDGKVYGQNNQISRQEALKTATIWPAYYVLKENVLGSLEWGKLADFIVLDKDYLTVPEDQMGSIRVLMTGVGGKIVHLVPSLARELGMQPRGAAVELGGPQAGY